MADARGTRTTRDAHATVSLYRTDMTSVDHGEREIWGAPPFAPIVTIIDHLYEAAALFTVDAARKDVALAHANALFLHDVATPLELALGRSLASFERRESQATTRNLVRNVLERARAASPHSVTYDRPGRKRTRPLVRRVTPLLGHDGAPIAVFVAQRILDGDRRYLHDDAPRRYVVDESPPVAMADRADTSRVMAMPVDSLQVIPIGPEDLELDPSPFLPSPHVDLEDLHPPSSLILFSADRREAIVRRHGETAFETVRNDIVALFKNQLDGDAYMRVHDDDTHLIVLPGQSLIPARKFAEQLRRTTGQLKGPSGEPMSITLALATLRDGETGQDALRRATNLMANARKARGGGFAGDAWQA